MSKFIGKRRTAGIVAIMVACIAAVSAYAFTASNTVSAHTAGAGAAAVTGYTVTGPTDCDRRRRSAERRRSGPRGLGRLRCDGGSHVRRHLHVRDPGRERQRAESVGRCSQHRHRHDRSVSDLV